MEGRESCDKVKKRKPAFSLPPVEVSIHKGLRTDASSSRQASSQVPAPSSPLVTGDPALPGGIRKKERGKEERGGEGGKNRKAKRKEKRKGNVFIVHLSGGRWN